MGTVSCLEFVWLFLFKVWTCSPVQCSHWLSLVGLNLETGISGVRQPSLSLSQFDILETSFRKIPPTTWHQSTDRGDFLVIPNTCSQTHGILLQAIIYHSHICLLPNTIINTTRNLLDPKNTAMITVNVELNNLCKFM